MIRRLLHIGTDFDSRDLAELLILAPEFKSVEAVTSVIAEGVRFWDKDPDRIRNLMYRLAKEPGDIAENLVRSIFKGHTNGNHNSTGYISSFIPVIVLATEQGDYWKTQELVNMGVDINEVCATGYGNTRLVYEGKRIGGCCESALTISIRKRSNDLTRLLLKSGADVNNVELKRRGGATALARAAQGDPGIFEELLLKGADPNDLEALGVSIFRRTTLLDKLLKAYAKMYPFGAKAFGSYALFMAIKNNDDQVIDKLLTVQVDVNHSLRSLIPGRMSHMTPLGVAIWKDEGRNTKLVQMLLNAGGNPDSIVEEGEIYYDNEGPHSALLLAVEMRSLSMVKLLIQVGARVNQHPNQHLSRTPLQLAAEIGEMEIVQYLRGEGAEVNDKPAAYGGATALQLAAIGGYIGIAEELLRWGADPNAAAGEEDGRTALEGAAEHGRIDMVKVLVEAGARIDEEQYESAGELAGENGHLATKRYLDVLYSEDLVFQSAVHALLEPLDL